MIGLRRTKAVDCEISVNGAAVAARAGEPLLAALGAASPTAAPGAFCGMGVCFACLVTVDGRSGVRSCVEHVVPGMVVVVESGADG